MAHIEIRTPSCTIVGINMDNTELKKHQKFFENGDYNFKWIKINTPEGQVTIPDKILKESISVFKYDED